MKTIPKLLICLFILIPLLVANATEDKYFIPDPAFRTALKAAYPTCFVADSLVKSCADTSSKIKLNIIGKGISSIEGIKYFTRLKKLYCGFNNLSSIPTLPEGLTFIDASKNCFCPAKPVKPTSISESNWIVEPNKTSCIVHFSLNESKISTPINVPVELKVGKFLYFDGIEANYTLPNLPNTSNIFTIEFWAKPTQLPSQLNYKEFKDALNMWNRFFIVKNGNSGSVKIYMNGLLKVTKPSDSSFTLANLLVGHGSNKYHGYMSELRIWNFAFFEGSNKLVAEDYYNDPILHGAWNMSSHSGIILRDETSKANHGAQNGCKWLNENNSLKYIWSSESELSENTGRVTTFNSNKGGTHIITVTATNSIGCNSSKNIIITNPGKGFKWSSPIEIGELTSSRSNYTDSQHFDPSNGFTNEGIYYSFILSSPALVKINTCKSVMDSTDLLIYKNDSLISYTYTSGPECGNERSSFAEYLQPGKYMIVSSPFYAIKNSKQDITTEVKADFSFYCPNSFPGKSKLDPIVISENVGSCFSYTDTRFNDFCYLNHFGYQGIDITYKIKLTSPQQLTVDLCDSELQNVLLDLYNKELGIHEYGYPDCSNNNNILSVYLDSGTYYIVVEEANGYQGNSTINISTGCNARLSENIENIENIEKTSISLYPNPTNSKTELHIPSLMEMIPVTISDLSGKIIQTINSISSLTEINTENLREGVYYISFIHQNKREIQKLIKLK